MDFFAQLAASRKKLAVTIASLSALTGLPGSHISNVLNGKKNAQAETLQALADAMNTEWVLVPRHLMPEVERLLAGKEIGPDQVPSTVDRLFGAAARD